MKKSQQSGDKTFDAARDEFRWLNERLPAVKSELQACTQEIENAKDEQRRTQETRRRDEPVLATQRKRPAEQERCQYGLLALLSHDLRNRRGTDAKRAGSAPTAERAARRQITAGAGGACA
ncbi:MAG: hypothetical protein WA970_15730 [Gammaproteobacteria bacterium]|jgi:hypothetical protein